jgi:hypothetical protein
MNASQRSDWSAGFWRRFYEDPATRICDPEELLAEGLWLGLTLTARLGLNIRSAIDYGSGNGIFTDGLDQALRITTKRIDPHCPDTRALVDDGDRAADLLVCRDVLQYLPRNDAVALLASFNKSGARALYVRVPCVGDGFTPESDNEITLRAAEWYRNQLSEYAHIGMGVFILGGVVTNRGVFE